MQRASPITRRSISDRPVVSATPRAVARLSAAVAFRIWRRLSLRDAAGSGPDCLLLRLPGFGGVCSGWVPAGSFPGSCVGSGFVYPSFLYSSPFIPVFPHRNRSGSVPYRPRPIGKDLLFASVGDEEVPSPGQPDFFVPSNRLKRGFSGLPGRKYRGVEALFCPENCSKGKKLLFLFVKKARWHAAPQTGDRSHVRRSAPGRKRPTEGASEAAPGAASASACRRAGARSGLHSVARRVIPLRKDAY